MINMNCSKKSMLVAMLCSAMMLSVSSAQNTSTGTIDVKLTLTGSCLINDTDISKGDVTLGELDFGSESTSYAGELDANLPITLRCSTETPATLTLNSGLYDGLSTGNGAYAMKHAASTNYVGYDIYKDVSKTTALANNDLIYTSLNDGTVETVTLYGTARMNSSDTYLPGEYSDTLTVDIAF